MDRKKAIHRPSPESGMYGQLEEYGIPSGPMSQPSSSIPPPAGSVAVRSRTSGLAVIVGIVGVFGFFFAPLALLVVIGGHVALNRIKQAGGLLHGAGWARLGLIFGYMGLALSVVAIVIALMLYPPGSSKQRRDSPVPLEQVSVPEFPSRLPEGRVLQPSGVSVRQFQLSGDGPGMAMQMRLYLPKGWQDADPASLPAVLVAPAGTNLLTGSEIGALDGDAYHDESLPYAEAGFVCLLYSLDGHLDEGGDTLEFTKAYNAFRKARAGVVNGRNALEYLLRSPLVDPERIFCAGHSSAGTLSLMLAMHEPRIAGCAAYAASVDVAAAHGDLSSEDYVEVFLPKFHDFVKWSSPITHTDKLRCPLFIFHSRRDGVTQFKGSKRLVADLAAQPDPVDVTFEAVERGGHYQSMVEHGIPRAIDWMKGFSAEVVRTWTSADGETLQATFLSKADDKVTLKRESDGREFTLPLERLSDSDKAYVEKQ